MAFKLLVESPDLTDFEYVIEEKNNKSESKMYIKGPYLMANEKNRNKRVYDLNEMAKEVSRYTDEMIKQNRAMGELNHPTTAEVDLERACHLVTELTQNDNMFIGKSRILSTPCGNIVRNLVLDGVKVGMSSRALGRIEECGEVNRVHEMKLVAIDCVADPSCPSAFVNGILESKEWIVAQNGTLEEIYTSFENSLKSLPKHEINVYLRDQITNFIQKLQKY